MGLSAIFLDRDAFFALNSRSREKPISMADYVAGLGAWIGGKSFLSYILLMRT